MELTATMIFCFGDYLVIKSYHNIEDLSILITAVDVYFNN